MLCPSTYSFDFLKRLQNFPINSSKKHLIGLFVPEIQPLK